MTVSALQARLAAVPSADGRLKAIFKWATSLTDDAIDAMGGNAAVAAQVSALYDTWIKPYDIPTIPNLVEPMVDEAIKNLIVSLIHAVDDEA